MTSTVEIVELDQVCIKIGVGLAMAVTPYMAATGVKLIRNQNIRPNRFDDSSVIFLNPSFAESHASKTIRENDVVIVRTGSNIGDACVVPEHFDGSQSFTTLTVRPNVKRLSPHYLAQFINSSFGRSEVERLMAGGGKGNLNSGELERFRVKLPPIEEQSQIAKLLTGWDVAIEKVGQLIVVQEQRHAGLLQLLITSIPARHHWATIEFGSVVTERAQKTITHDQHPVLTSSRRGLLLQSEYFSRQVASENNTAYKVMRHGDFTFRSMSDDGRFVFNRLTTLEAGVISPAYGVFYATDCYPEFLAHFLNSSYFANVLNRESQGGTRKALRFSSIAKAETDFPSLSEQKRIAIILDASRAEIDIQKQRQTVLREQKRGLMQKLLTGQWRVPVESKEMAA
jgi:type I restriction enzyme, S subunit